MKPSLQFRIANAIRILPVICVSAFSIFFIPGCGPAIRLISPATVQREKVDSLISFKEAIAGGNYLRGARKLVAADRAKILNETGSVREEMKPRLRSLRLKNIVNDRSVRLKRGKLTGILAALPVVRQGKPDSVDTDFDAGDQEPETVGGDSTQKTLHAAANLFFSDIRSGTWQFVLNGMHPGTRSNFVGKNGKIKAGACKRLSEIDTSAWRALSLRNGKLVGVVLLIPPPETGLEKSTDAFFDAIAAGKWDAALDMLVDSEKEKISRPSGGIKSEFKKKLSDLDREDWDSLFWYHEKLSGVLELLGEPSTVETR